MIPTKAEEEEAMRSRQKYERVSAITWNVDSTVRLCCLCKKREAIVKMESTVDNRCAGCATRQYYVKDGARISLLNPAIGYGPIRSKIYHALIDVIKCLEEEQRAQRR